MKSQSARPEFCKKRAFSAVQITHAAFLGLVLWGAALSTGCEKVTTETVEKWKGTVKGPDKLQDALKSGSVDPEMRARAAVALQGLGRGDFVATTFRDMSDRTAVVSALVKLEAAAIAGGKPGAQDARDVLFTVREHTAGAERASVDQSLMVALEHQMTSTGNMGGSQSLAKIVEALGPASTPMLVKLMALPKAPHAEVADLLAKVGDADAKSQAGDALLVFAKKSTAVEPGMWRALGLLPSPAVVNFLQHQVDKAPWQQAQQAARALQVQPHPELAEFAVSRAADRGLHGNVREEMFGLAGSCCGEATVPGLIQIIQTASDPIVKYRTYEAILQAAGPKGIDAGLAAFAEKASYKPEDFDDFLVKETQKLGAAARPSLLSLLTSPSVIKRTVAVLVLAKLGTADDAQQLKSLANDKGVVKGFPPARSVGREATRVASLLAKGT